jgi:NAD(P) transhydrogenase subunit beta
MTDFMRVATDVLVIVMILVGVWQFRSPRGALRGNGMAAAALALAIYLVAVRHEILSPVFVTVLLAVGAVGGFWLASKVKMIQAPAMVAIQHGAGGLGAFLVCSIELMRGGGPTLSVEEATGIAGLAIGGATFSGSLVAGGKLANVLSQPPQIIRGHGWWLSAVVVALAAVSYLAGGAAGTRLAGILVVSVALAAGVGILVAVRIGGADMPVLISFLNATAGVAAAFTGVVIGNNLLVAGGATVAASGSILTLAMCRAMNRSLLDILTGGVGVLTDAGPAPAAVAGATGHPEAPRPARADPFQEAVTALKEAGSVIIVPGYGMALAQAQFETVELSRLLEAAGKKVRFAIHPVAGRMPGHMHVLLSEAEAGWDSLVELPDINPEFPDTDVAMVVGASDVVNPAAMKLADTPISGMPILHVHEARHCIVVNLDDKPGYSGVHNMLYDMPEAITLWGDAKVTLQSLLTSLKEHA